MKEKTPPKEWLPVLCSTDGGETWRTFQYLMPYAQDALNEMVDLSEYLHDIDAEPDDEDSPDSH